MTPQQRKQAIQNLSQQYPDRSIHEIEIEPGNPRSSGIVYVGDPSPAFLACIQVLQKAVAAKKRQSGR